MDDPLVQLAAEVQAACLSRGLMLSTAESCTGGLIAHLITEIPGSSRYFRGGVVSYSNEAKQDLLDVPPDVLAAHGAVSAQVARAMADGAARRFGTELAVAVTGISGPDGGTAAKPVGLTYVAVRAPSGTEVRRYQWAGDRSANKREGAEAALRLVLEMTNGMAGADTRPEPVAAAQERP
jgi:PncC family amidohydrolase